VAKVVIGVDPHKRINAVVVLNSRGKVLARAQFMNDTQGFRELRKFSRQWRPRTWAIEGCNGVGKHVAQRLVAAGERVVDVSTRRAALVRVFAGGNGRKNDDTDAESIALVGLQTHGLPAARRDDLTVSCGCCRTVARSASGCGSRRCAASTGTWSCCCVAVRPSRWWPSTYCRSGRHASDSVRRTSALIRA